MDGLILNIYIMDTDMVMVVESYKGQSNRHKFVFFFSCSLDEWFHSLVMERGRDVLDESISLPRMGCASTS